MPTNAFARHHLRRELAPLVRDTRQAVGWTQQALADRAGVSRGLVASIETGRVNASVDAASALLDALGVRYRIAADVPFLVDRRRQREPAHARCSTYVARHLESSGWLVRREVEVVHGRSHGWLDLLAFHERTGAALVVEVKTEIHDVGLLERTMAWYEREAWGAMRRLGWHPRRLGSAVVVLQTEANEIRVRENRPALAAAFPVRAATLLDALADPVRLAHVRALALIDPRSRRRAWLRPTRTDGGRAEPPYADYAMFMRTIRRR
jgi:transcriptional regulator with XRE-family HTH domain